MSSRVFDKIRRWEQELEATSDRFVREFGDLTREELNWKPEPTTWSIAENIDHLIKVNSSYFPVLDRLEAGDLPVPFMGRLPLVPRILGALVLRALSPDRKNRIKTFPIWEPSTSEIEIAVLDDFNACQETTVAYIKRSRGLLENGAVISSPAGRNVVYTLERAFDIIVVHETRHFHQAREVLDLR